MGDAEDGDAQHDADSRTGVDTEDRRIGQRIARRALQHGAGKAKRGAHHQPDDGAWQAQVPDDAMIGRSGVEGGQGGPDGVESDRPSAHGDGQKSHGDNPRDKRKKA